MSIHQAPEVDQFGFTGREKLPAQTDVVIVGGGIVGASAALFLAQQGISTVLCEKGRVAAEQSSRNWGWIRNVGRDPRELPLMIEALRLWDQMHQLVQTDVGFRRTGIVYLCESEPELARRDAWLKSVQPHGLDTRLVGRTELQRMLPRSAFEWSGALYAQSDARAEPQLATSAIARQAKALGTKIFTTCAVRGVETAAGRICAAVTEMGRIRCQAVVLAGGAGSRLFCRRLGVRLPQLRVLASVMRLEAFDGAPELAAWGPGFAYRKRANGESTVTHGTFDVVDIAPERFQLLAQFFPMIKLEWSGLKLRAGTQFFREARLIKRWCLDDFTPFEQVRILDPLPYEPALAAAQANLERMFPISCKTICERWAGLVDATPDAIPIISSVAAFPGLYVAAGFSGHGFGIGPAAGRLVADLVTGKPAIVDPAPFAYGRFLDGSRPLPMTGL